MAQVTNTPQDHWNVDEPLDLRHYWNVIDRKKWAILGLASGLALIASLIAFAMTPVYRASATILLESEQANVVSIEEVYGLDTKNQQYYLTQFEILNSPPVAKAVVEMLDLANHPRFTTEDQGLSWRAWLPFAQAEQSSRTTADRLQAVMAAYYRGLTIEPIRDTQLVRVHFESEDAALAARIANGHAQAYIDSMLGGRASVTESALAWMTDRLGGLEDALRASEQRLQAFREQEQLVDAEGLRALPARKVQDLTSRLVAVRQALSEAEIAYAQVATRENMPPQDLQTIPAILKDQVVQNFQQAQAAAKRRVAELQKRYGPQHPAMIAAQSELDEATENLGIQHASVAEAIRNEYEAAKAEEAALMQALAAAESEYQQTSRKESELNALQREVDTNRTLYELFYNRISETSLTGELEAAPARIVTPAGIPTVPAKPNKSRIVGMVFVLTLFAGIMLAFLLESLNNTVRSAKDVEEKLKLPLLGMLPLVRNRGKKSRPPGSSFAAEPGFDEAVRTVRTGISLDNLERPHKVLVIASSIGGEGKTTVAVNLAKAFARTEKVLLLDADMRRPSVGRALHMQRDGPGLSELLAEQATLADCVSRDKKYEKLDILLPGSHPPDPSQLLSSARLRNALKVLCRHYDRIIIDTPPILPVSDGLILSTHADSVVFVTKCDSTSIRQITQALDMLLRVKARVLGVVINQLDTRKAEKYSDYGYGGYYESYEPRSAAN